MIKKYILYFIIIILSIITSINLLSQNCFDYTHLYDTSLVTCYYGNYDDPYRVIGIYPDRHTVMLDINQTDTNTNNQLYVVPIGDTNSIKLGNSHASREAEAITYTFNVDTNNFDLLILKYAIVLESPNHPQLEQPRFTLEILDNNNQLLNECGFTDFYASGSLGWDSIPNSDVIWKDWTAIGLDLLQYNNQTVKIRLTTYDCERGGHFGYAYFNLKCGSREIKQLTCGDVGNLTFQAPLGFNYIWYKESNPNVTLSTSREVILPNDSNIYICKCTYPENYNCFFYLSVRSVNQYPFAAFDYNVNPCTREVTLLNHSMISNDDMTSESNDTCDNIKWFLPNNTESTLNNPSFIFDSSGAFPVTLIASMYNGLCVDTLIKNIIIDDSLYSKIKFSYDTTICYGDSTTIFVNKFERYIWNIGDTTQNITVQPLSTTQYLVNVVDRYNCNWKDSITIYVNPSYKDTINASICEKGVYELYGFKDSITGFYSTFFQTINGCDSNYYLNLKVNPIYNDTIFAVICGREEYNFNGFNEDENGFYTHSFQTIGGCDSIINLNLKVNPSYYDTIIGEICKGEAYNENGFNETQEGLYLKSFQTTEGCDSNYYLNLRVNPTYNIQINKNICEGTTYNLNGFNESNTGTYSQNLLTNKGCDSIINLNLFVINKPDEYSFIDDKYIVTEDFPITIDVSCDDCISYLWNTGSRDSVYEITHIGNYYVYIYHLCGYFLDSVIVVYPEINIYFPNAFTPLEMSNNTFFPICESNEKVFIESFEIYNRWGERIYSSKTKGWDGKCNGKYCDSGVYIWRLLYKTKYSGKSLFEQKGEVNLIR
ncbi:MAG: gliding motility-associated C-terminal domain-containing protein [Bacteroidales bacterium]|jgi:gliding motility-associated-like protein